MGFDLETIESKQKGFSLRTATLLHTLGLRIGYKPRLRYQDADIRFRRKPWFYKVAFSELIAKLRPAWLGANGQDTIAIRQAVNQLVIVESSETLEALQRVRHELETALQAIEDYETQRLIAFKCRLPHEKTRHL